MLLMTSIVKKYMGNGKIHGLSFSEFHRMLKHPRRKRLPCQVPYRSPAERAKDVHHVATRVKFNPEVRREFYDCDVEKDKLIAAKIREDIGNYKILYYACGSINDSKTHEEYERRCRCFVAKLFLWKFEADWLDHLAETFPKVDLNSIIEEYWDKI